MMKKREFLGFLLIIFGLTAAGSFAYPLVGFLAPPSGKARLKQITLKKSEIPAGEELNRAQLTEYRVPRNINITYTLPRMYPWCEKERMASSKD
jgi:hypothetical protein